MGLAKFYEFDVVIEQVGVLVFRFQSIALIESGDLYELCTPFLSRNISSPAKMKGVPWDVNTIVWQVWQRAAGRLQTLQEVTWRVCR